MGKPNAGVCEMEIRRLTGAFKKADQQRHTFDAHFCQGQKHETSGFKQRCQGVKG